VSLNKSPAGTQRPWVVLAVCCLSLLLVSMDVTIVNVALPSIRRDLHASVSGLQWTVDAYTLVLAMLLMLSGSLGDRLGRRRVFQTGLLLFTAGSLLCSVAPSLGWLVAFRAVQAVGGSMLNPVALSIVVNVFADARQRARAIGVWAAVVGISLALGPVVGGLLVSAIGWRSVFWVNVPIGLAAVVLTQVFVPESRSPRARALDPVGQALVVVMLGTLTYAVIGAPDAGWGSARTVVLLCLSGAATVGLVVVEPRRREPLVDLRFFRSVPFAAATATAVAAFAVLGTFLFVTTLYLQNVRGDSPVRAGLTTLPMALTAGVCAPLSGRLVAARGARLPLVVSGVTTAAAMLLLASVTPDTPLAYLLGAYALFGIGFGLVNAPITNTATSGMPRAQAGVAAAVASSSRQAGTTLGVAVSGSIVAGTAGTGFTDAAHLAWLLAAGCGVVVAVLGLVSTGPWASATAERTRALLDPDGEEAARGPRPAAA